MLPRNLNVLIQRDGDEFIAYCPELSLSTGKEPTEERARAILKEGIALAFLVDDHMETKPRKSRRRAKRSSAAVIPASDRVM